MTVCAITIAYKLGRDFEIGVGRGTINENGEARALRPAQICGEFAAVTEWERGKIGAGEGEAKHKFGRRIVYGKSRGNRPAKVCKELG